MSAASNGDLESSCMFTVKWKVKQFTAFFDSDENELKSPELLTVYANNVLHWQLRLSKNYDRDGYRNYLAIYLDYLDAMPMSASVCFAMINRSGSDHTRVFQRVTKAKFDAQLRFCGIIDFVQQAVIVGGSMNLLVNDELIVCCEIRFQETRLCAQFSQLSLQSSSTEHQPRKVEATKAAPVKSAVVNKAPHAPAPAPANDHLTALSADLEKLLESDKYTDVSFIVGELTLRAHKSVLTARSRTFQRMFAAHEQNAAEKKRSLVAVKDVPYDAMKEVLRYLYSGRVNDAERMPAELLRAAEKYDVAGLKTIAEAILAERLNFDNALDYLTLAKNYNAVELRAKVMDFVIKRLADYVKTPEFRDLTVDIKDDLLNAVSKSIHD